MKTAKLALLDFFAMASNFHDDRQNHRIAIRLPGQEFAQRLAHRGLDDVPFLLAFLVRIFKVLNDQFLSLECTRFANEDNSRFQLAEGADLWGYYRTFSFRLTMRSRNPAANGIDNSP